MSRLSFRPRPLDIHKKLPIIKSIKEFEEEDVFSSAAATRSSFLQRGAAEAGTEVHQIPAQRNSREIPTPQYKVVETYERDYTCTFKQPTSYLRVRGARVEIGEFVDYDLDNEDEDWLQGFNNEWNILAPEKLETLLFKLEILDHKTRQKAGVITPTFTSPIPVLLELDAAFENLQSLSIRFAVFKSVYNYWKAKRRNWMRPTLRRLQPPPPVNDTNPYNVFRPREKAHRHNTRRVQGRENNVRSFQNLRQVRQNLEQAKTVLEALIKREEKKREFIETEVSLQRIQLKYKHEAQLVEDSLALPGFQPTLCGYGSSEDDSMDSDDASNGQPHPHHAATHQAVMQHLRLTNSKQIITPTERVKREPKQRPLTNKWPHNRDPSEPVLLFTRHLDPVKLASTGIMPPQDPPVKNDLQSPLCNFHGRVGRGGRIIFDRRNPLNRALVGHKSSYVTPIPRPPQPNG